MKVFGSLLCFVLLLGEVHAQTILENNPARIRFRQIRTSNFRVIFPDGSETEAQRVANTLETVRSPEAETMGKEPRRISIILQSQSSVSNGFVSITPRRSEFYMFPSQDYNFVGTNDWLDLLATHEYRHVVQFQHARQGFNKLIFYLFGQNALAGMSYVAAPQWFWEGDAVATETAFTPSGRGRIPNFSLVFKTNLLEGRTFNYHKQYLRSYKHNIPNHYVLGYHMVSYLRERTGDPDIWEKIAGRSWRVPFIPFAFSNAIKKESGTYVTQLYREMADTLRTRWQNEINQLQLTPFETINKRSNTTYTDYMFPQPLADGSVIAMKSGLADIQQFVRLDGDRETKIFVPGYVVQTGMLSAVSDRIVWTEYGYSPRWRVRNYSIVKGYEAFKRERKMVSPSHGRVAGASLSPDGQKVVAVQSSEEYIHNVIIIDYASQQLLKEFPNPGNAFYAMPRWSADGQWVVALKNTDAGKAVVQLHAENGNEEILLDASDENIGSPQLVGKYLLFSSPCSGIDNIYAVDLDTKQRYQITTSKYGAYNPAVSPDGSTLYYNDQTRDGMDVARVAFNPRQWKPYDAPSQTSSLVRTLVTQEGNRNLLQNVPDQKYPVSRYFKAGGIINPFAWGPYASTDLNTYSIGITSRDILSTTQIDLGYQFDYAEQTGMWRAHASYQGWAPIVDFTYTQGERTVDEGDYNIRVVEGTDTTDMVRNVTVDWKEKNIEAGLRIPLITTQSKYNGAFTISNYIGYTHAYDYENGVGNGRFVPAFVRNDTVVSVYPLFTYVGNNDLLYNHFTLSAYRLLKVAPRDLQSRWGQAVTFNYYKTMGASDLYGGVMSLWARLYFPGVMKNHSLYGHWAYQKNLVNADFSDYHFRNTIPIPRGQSVNRFEEFYSMSANYALPIWYPDVAVGPLLNIQRVRLNAFVDYAFGSSRMYDGSSVAYSSVGGELTFDINVLRFLPQLDITFRLARGIDPARTTFDVILGTINF